MVTKLRKKTADVPGAPGVYLMKDPDGHVLYVGKARNLKKRLCSYFRDGRPKDLKTNLLVGKVADFETIVTHSEKEAFVLESNLIKRHRPRYNVILKDDKRYPCLRLNIKSAHPNLTIARKIQKDGALYFGPFPSAGAVRETLKLIHKTFKIRKCRGAGVKPRERPCLNYQMGLCLGPCSKPVSPEVYAKAVEEVILFLKGRTPDLVKNVRKQMAAASEREDFEEAAVYRDRLFALEKTLEKQVATSTDLKDRDVVGIARKENTALIMVLFIRGGFLLGSRPFFFSESVLSDVETITSFLKQYYEKAPFIPQEVLLSTSVEDKSLVEEWLSDLKGKKVHIATPQRGEKAALVRMADQNAAKSLREQMAAAEADEMFLERVKKRLDLVRRPERIECFDLSHLGGTHAAGGMVVFEKGKPNREAYRKYRIRAAQGDDDYGKLKEVLERRYRKTARLSPLPDLLMVDGGKGQLNMAVAVLKALDIFGSCDVVAIAKRDALRGEEEDKIFKPGRKNPLNLKRDSDVLLFLQRVRDEAHRAVITYHRELRSKAYRRSALEEIPGIGKARKKKLLKHFGSLKRMSTASVEELASAPGMTQETARAVFRALGQPHSKISSADEINPAGAASDRD